MRVWLDDERPMPNDYDTHVKTAEEAISLLMTGKVTKISLDHDLGREKTGYDVAKWIEENAVRGNLQPLYLTCHSMNVAGKQNIHAAFRTAKMAWMKS